MIYNIFAFFLVSYIEYKIGKSVFIEARKYDEYKRKYVTVYEPFLNRGLFILLLLFNFFPVIREVILLGIIGYIIAMYNGEIIITGKANDIIIKLKKFLKSELW